MEKAYTVSKVNAYIKNLFAKDMALSNIPMKGEVSNCKYHTSGHIYFTLKDAKSQMACVMFAGNRNGLNFRLTEGQSVIVIGGISVYERDGKYQMYAKEILLDGTGYLYEKYEQLKKELAAEGLFDLNHKKKIPYFSKKIGIVTASTGAAIQDMVNVGKRRNPYAQLILYPALVQGEGAAASIVKGIQTLDSMELDVIIIGRGGGSIEDLWGFNEEVVARAIYHCNTPIISAVGHETDTTIADYVADLRAPTPSAAAELAVCNIVEVYNQINDYTNLLNREIVRKITEQRNLLARYKLKLDFVSPASKIREKRQYLMDSEGKINQLMDSRLKEKRHQLALYIEKINGLSPLEKLNRGFAYITDAKQKPLTKSQQVAPGDSITIKVVDGDIRAKVEETFERKRDGLYNN